MIFQAHAALETYKRCLMIVSPLTQQIRILTQERKRLCCAAQQLVAEVGLILVVVDHNLNFYIFKCFEYAQWCANAK